jgi:hypothetical protein
MSHESRVTSHEPIENVNKYKQYTNRGNRNTAGHIKGQFYLFYLSFRTLQQPSFPAPTSPFGQPLPAPLQPSAFLFRPAWPFLHHIICDLSHLTWFLYPLDPIYDYHFITFGSFINLVSVDK